MQRQNIRNKRNLNNTSSLHPTTWKSEVIITRKCRFRASAAVAEIALQYIDLAGAVAGIIGLTSTTSVEVARAIRIKKFEIFFNATTAGTVVEGVIDWNSGFNAGTAYAPGSSMSEYSTSTAEYSHISSRPPPDSQQDLWHSALDTTAAVTITLPAGGVLDITLDYVINDSNAAVTGPAVTGATVALIYHKQPDANLVVMGNLNTIA
jgi:hypothetical protein